MIPLWLSAIAASVIIVTCALSAEPQGINRPELAFSPGVITTVAGSGSSDYSGDGGLATAAGFRGPSAVVVDHAGNLYIADTENNVIRMLDSRSGLISTIAGNGQPLYSGDGGPATASTLQAPTGLALDSAGNVFIADSGNNVIREIDSSGNISTVAGAFADVGGPVSAFDVGDGGLATNAVLWNPSSIALDAQGTLYIADTYNNRIRRVDASSHIISTIAGNGSADYTGDGADARGATLSSPVGIAIDNSGNVIIADSANDVLRRIDARTNIITTIAGGGTNEGVDTLGDGGPATNAQLFNPMGVAVDSFGNIYVADTFNSLVRQINAVTNIITVVAGIDPTRWEQLINEDPTLDKSSLDAAINVVTGVFISPSGDLYIVDSGNEIIRRASFAVSSLQFWNSGNKQAILTNLGNSALEVTSVTINGPDPGYFTLTSNNCETTLAPGEQCQIGIAFASASPDNRAAEIIIADSATGSPHTLDLNATASFDPSVNVPSLLFGDHLVGSVTTVQTVTLSNRGAATLNVAQPSISGADNGDFVVSSTDCGNALTPYQTCTVSLAFRPRANGSRSATLYLTESTGGNNFYETVSLFGAGTVPPVPPPPVVVPPPSPLLVSSVNVSFTNQAIGVPSLVRNVKLSNPGTVPVSLGTRELSGVGSADFAIESSDCGSTLAPLSSCTVSLTFTPSGVGARSAILDLNDETSAPSHILVSGFGNAAALEFIPVRPCRVGDTRNARGPFGGPALEANSERVFLIPESACGIPSTALAYSLNITVVTGTPLGYLAIWPSGQPKPNVSILNSYGRIKANAAIVAAGTSGGVSLFATDRTHLIVDISGYFVQAGTSSGLLFYPLKPCRIADTRYGAQRLKGGQERSFSMVSNSCNVPSTAQAYSLNFTAVPSGSVGFLAAWPTGQKRPLVSTINSIEGVVTANAGIVPAGTNGSISIYSSGDTDLVIDVNGYFAPPTAGGLSLYTLTPCRVLDTRTIPTISPFSGILAVPGTGRGCKPGVAAQAFVMNATVVPSRQLGYLALWPDGQEKPWVSTLNSVDGAITSNMAIIPTSNGSIDAFAQQPTSLILDLFGYFAP